MKSADLVTFKKIASKYKHAFLDSMIFSYYFYETIPYSNLSEVLIERFIDNKLKITTSIISYLEVLSYPALEEDLDKIDFIKSFLTKQQDLKILTVDIEIADIASSLRRRYKLSTPDSIQYSVAISEQSDVFVTNDDHYKKIMNKENIPIIFLDDYVR